MSDQPFGGAKVIYIAKSYVEKESKQPEPDGDDIIQRPSSNERGDLISYYHKTPEMNSYHSKCLSVNTDCIVNIGLDILDDSKEPDIKNRLAIVNERRQSFQEVISRVVLDYKTIGNGYLEVVRSNDRKSIAELYHAPGVNFWARRSNSSRSPFVYRSPEGDQKDFTFFDPEKPPEDDELGEVVVFQQYCQSSRYYGLPDWRGVMPKIELDYYATLYNQKFFINSGVPDLAIIVEGGRFDEDVEKQVKAFFQENFKGVANSHRTLYLPINDKDITVKFEKLAMSEKEKEGSFKELQHDCRDSIVSAHGTPPRLVGIITAGQLGGGGEAISQLKIYQEITINPVQDLFEMKLGPVLKMMGIDTDWKFKEINTKIQEKDSEFYPAMVTSGILEVNEAREELGYGPLDESQINDNTNIITDEMVDEIEKMVHGI